MAGALAMAASLVGVPTASAEDLSTREVSEEKWQEVWSAIAPNVADEWRCYGRPREFIRDPRWVIVSYRTVTSPECEGVPTDPYPELVVKRSGTWQSVSLLGPWPCSEAGDLAFAKGAPKRVVKDLMKDGWCDPSFMWRGYMERFLTTKECPKQLTVRPNKYRVGFIGREVDGRKMEDGAVAWTCARAAGGAQDQFLTVFLAGNEPRQITIRLEMFQFKSLVIRHNRIVVSGGSYTDDAPRCCPDLLVTDSYQMRDGKLVRLKQKVTPV